MGAYVRHHAFPAALLAALGVLLAACQEQPAARLTSDEQTPVRLDTDEQDPSRPTRAAYATASVIRVTDAATPRCVPRTGPATGTVTPDDPPACGSNKSLGALTVTTDDGERLGVSVDERTRLLREGPDGYERADWHDFTVGSRVSVWDRGWVRASAPPGIDAAKVVLHQGG